MTSVNIPATDRSVAPTDNRPPLITADELAGHNHGMLDRVLRLEEEAEGHPEQITDDIAQGLIQDTIKAIDTATADIEKTRVGTKAPYLEASRIVDGFFKALANPDKGDGRLDKARLMLSRRATLYLRAKEAEARRQREEEARKLREEAEMRRREQIEREQEADALREKNERESREEAKRLNEEAAQISSEAAQLAERATAAANEAVSSKPADFARTRSALGSLGTLVQSWNFRIVNPNDMKPEELWQFIPMAAKEQAIRAFIRANRPGQGGDIEAFKSRLAGVELIPTTEGQFR